VGLPFFWERIERTMSLVRRAIGFLLPLLLLGAQGSLAQAAPKLVSVFPLGGQRDTTVEVEMQGTGLEGTYAVWLGPGTRLKSPGSPLDSPYTKGSDGIEAHVLAVPDPSRAKVRLVIASDAPAGLHPLSLVTPTGVSGAIPFWVGPDAVLQETAAPHTTPDTAQPVKLPVAVNGRISESGQLAYYAFEIGGEQTVVFEVVSLHGTGFDPQFALYEAGGSFLDPRRSRRLLFHEEVTQGGMPANRRMTYHFTKPGSYLVSVSTVFAQGGGGFSYLVRIAPAGPPAEKEDALAWAGQRLRELRSRAVGAPPTEVNLVKEAEPNEDPEQANAFEVPAVLEGTIGRPGDVDHFRFRAKAGQKLAFEFQTPHARPPQFNPRLDILNAKGAVVLSNLHVQDGKVGTVDAKVIRVDPEVLGKFDEDGEYTLRVRDLTSVHGSPDHAYRVLVRPQVPHVGDVRVEPDGPVNLTPGARQRWTVTAPGKEDFAGTLALSVEGLPPGVRAFVGASGTAIDVLADASAPCTPLPQVVRISGLPLVGKESGSAFLAAEIPVMVIKK
jgi:hypothetical protein